MESRTQGSRPRPRTQKNPRPRTDFPRTDTLEAKDRNAQGQGQGPRTQVQVLSKKKRYSQKFFRRSPKKKRFSQKFFRRSPQKNVALHKILTIQKIVLSSTRGQANFRGLEASRPSQGLDLQGQGLQNLSSRTPPLVPYSSLIFYRSLKFHSFVTRKKIIVISRRSYLLCINHICKFESRKLEGSCFA